MDKSNNIQNAPAEPDNEFDALARSWFNFQINNRDKVRPVHTALYYYILYTGCTLGSLNRVVLPAIMVMAVLSLNSFKAYKKALNDLVQFRFIEIVQDRKAIKIVSLKTSRDNG